MILSINRVSNNIMFRANLGKTDGIVQAAQERVNQYNGNYSVTKESSPPLYTAATFLEMRNLRSDIKELINAVNKLGEVKTIGPGM